MEIDAQIAKGGDPIPVDFVAPAAGQYEIACSEFRGSGHGPDEGRPHQRGGGTTQAPRKRKVTIMWIPTTIFAVAALGLCVSGCSGPGSQAGGNAGNPNAPSNAIIINVVAIKGSQSFSPNPANIPSGQMVVWHNTDSVTHRVALFDRSIDTGNLEPGAFSAPMALRAIGEYRCTIHPEMVGALIR